MHAPTPDTAVLSFGPYRLLPARRLLLDHDRPLPLGSRAFDLLVLLASRAGEVIPSAELLARVWPTTVVDAGSLRVHMAALRKALGDGRSMQRYIANVPGQGYVFVAPVGVGTVADTDAEAGAGTVATDVDGDTPTAAEPAASARAPAAAAGPSPPPTRPSPTRRVARLFGREGTIADLAALLPRRRCVTLVGTGGLGKTSVALAVAERLTADTGWPAAVVELASLDRGDRIPAAVAAALGVTLNPIDPLRTVLAHLRTRPTLLLLDNCEHLIDAVAELAETLLRGAPELVLLATSREALRIEGEWVHRLAPLALPAAGDQPAPQAALGFPAIALFVARTSAGLDHFDVEPADVPVICDLCRRLDGNPLAIELAAASVGLLGLRGLAAHLNDRLALLTHGRRTALPRHQTLRAALDWSHDLLTAAEQRLLRRLAVFRGAFTTDAAVAVGAEREPVARAEAEAVSLGLGDLVAKSMLVADTDGDRLRYRLLETTRHYAAERLADAGEDRLVTHRLAAHLLAVCREARRRRDRHGDAEWLAEHAHRIDDLRAVLAWAWSDDGDPPLAAALTAESAPLWFALSLMAEYRPLAEQALARAPAGTLDADAEMALQEAHGHALWHTRGSGPAMAAAFERALTLADTLGATAYQLRSIWGLWLICNTAGDYAGSVRYAERYGRIAEPTGDAALAVVHDRMMALGLHFHGQQARAEFHAHRVLEHPGTVNHSARNSGFQFDQRVSALTVLARVLWVRGRPGAALAHARAAVDEALAIGHTLSLCYALANGAVPVMLWAGEHETAERWTTLLLERSNQQSLDFWQSFGIGYRQALDRLAARAAGHATATAPLTHPATGLLLLETLATVDTGLVDPRLDGRAASGGGGWCAAELLRLQALAEAGRGETDAATRTLARALDIARDQQAWAWTLRSALALHGLGADDGPAVLDEVLARFSTADRSPDLDTARALAGVTAG